MDLTKKAIKKPACVSRLSLKVNYAGMLQSGYYNIDKKLIFYLASSAAFEIIIGGVLPFLRVEITQSDGGAVCGLKQ